MEISATISSFLTHVRVEKGLSANTVSAYRRDLVKFDAFAQKRKLSLEAVSRDDLVDFLAGLYRQKLESKSVARHLVTLRNFFRFAAAGCENADWTTGPGDAGGLVFDGTTGI